LTRCLMQKAPNSRHPGLIASSYRGCAFLTMVVMLLSAVMAYAQQDAPARDLVELGKKIFFDATLSRTGKQSCASCHAPEVGFSGPNERFNRMGAYEGAIHGQFGKRKPQTAAYVGSFPVLHIELKDGVPTFVGGSFWDGRATGRRLNDPLAEQAQAPLLNSIEQALPDSACVVQRLCAGSYAELYGHVSPGTCNIPALTTFTCRKRRPVQLDAETRRQIATGFDLIARALDNYEESEEVSAYTSKYDAWQSGKAELSTQELEGLAIFSGKGKCNNCHPATSLSEGTKALFTDFTYDNLGVPRNPANPRYRQRNANPEGRNWTDPGLGGFLQTEPSWRKYSKENVGRFKVPTLRNVDKRPHPAFVKSYMHNGYFTSLEAVVGFYNTRDVKPSCQNEFTPEAEALARGCWPAPEIPQTVNREELGKLNLTADEEKALVAFLKTLSDGFILTER
jgi:cytochrome c peroxidase